MAPEARSRGHLNPGTDARVSRLAPPPDLVDTVVHFWVPEWDLPAGRSSRQMVLSYPLLNLVLQPGAPEGDVTLHGPRTAVSYRVLSGRGWAIGVLLRPTAVPAMLGAARPVVTILRDLVDSWVALDAPELMSNVLSSMAGGGSCRTEAAVGAVAGWLRVRLRASGAANRDGRLANALLELLDAMPSDTTERRDAEPPRFVAEVARELGTSTRTLQRVALGYIGFTPAALIRRRRLQDAADRLRRDPTTDLARLALDVGYSDHAHLTRDFRQVLGFTPSAYRDGQNDTR
ncbi:MAG: AraC family transcriptional regulator [Chloroflexi bacterium]|nr:AraC family transcriptional regulator [Chloroflexota bacterium]